MGLFGQAKAENEKRARLVPVIRLNASLRINFDVIFVSLKTVAHI
jgi:hypothetical protein